ncbi:MAG: hypothetical protein OXH52_15360 [Gammaproteobacteria bacterium]|nr:hypothetical protein [Gammaproteobacteria bacterium]
MVEDDDLDLLVAPDTRTGDGWRAGPARRGHGGEGSIVHSLPALTAVRMAART